jgi:hypothetical protein
MLHSRADFLYREALPGFRISASSWFWGVSESHSGGASTFGQVRIAGPRPGAGKEQED